MLCMTVTCHACRLYAYEGVGMLLGQEELPADEQRAYIAALVQPLIHQVALWLTPPSSCTHAHTLDKLTHRTAMSVVGQVK